MTAEEAIDSLKDRVLVMHENGVVHRLHGFLPFAASSVDNHPVARFGMSGLGLSETEMADLGSAVWGMSLNTDRRKSLRQRILAMTGTWYQYPQLFNRNI